MNLNILVTVFVVLRQYIFPNPKVFTLCLKKSEAPSQHLYKNSLKLSVPKYCKISQLDLIWRENEIICEIYYSVVEVDYGKKETDEFMWEVIL